jgi:hypothetical protein
MQRGSGRFTRIECSRIRKARDFTYIYTTRALNAAAERWFS